MRIRGLVRCAAVAGSALAWAGGAGAQEKADWARWRGPDGTAHVRGAAVPAGWPAELTRRWSVEVGPGLSSPVVADGRAYVLSRDGDDEVVTALNLADGSEAWRHRYRSPFFANGGAINPARYPASQGKGPFATPVLHDGRLYALGVDRVLSSLDLRTGELLWRRHYLPVEVPERLVWFCRPCGCEDDGKKFDAPGLCPSCRMGLTAEGLETAAKSGGGNYYGAAASPLIDGDVGIVHVGNPAEGVVIAFDPQTGEDRWRLRGPVIAYASPVVARIHGTRQVVVVSRESVAGIDLRAGTLLWSFPIENNAHVTTPVVLDDLVIAARYQGPTFAVRVARDAERWSVALAWENGEATQWLSSPVLARGRLYGFFFSKKGHYAALHPRTGAVLWAGDGRRGDAASLVVAGDRLIGLQNDGTLVVLRRKGDSLEPVRRYEVAAAPTWTYPVILEDGILIRDEHRLARWSVR